MPTWIHNCLTGWVMSAQHYWNKRGQITDREYDALGSEVGTSKLPRDVCYSQCDLEADLEKTCG